MTGTGIRTPTNGPKARLAGAVTLLAAAALSTAACTSSSSGSSGSATGSSTGTAASAAGAAVASASPGAPAPALPVLGGREATVDGTRLRVDLNELRVEGRITRLNFSVNNLDPDPNPGSSSTRFQIAQHLSDGIFQASGQQTAAGDGDSADGVYLVDTVNAKRYLAARTADGSCVCSTDLANQFVDPGHSLVLTVVYAALPAGVTAVDVDVPGFGSFPQVQVSR
jgi:hypothetical protein